MERIDGALLMSHEYATRALVELMQIGKTPSGANPILHDAPEAFNGIEMVSAPRWQEMQPKLLVPVCQCRRKLCARWIPLRSATMTTSFPVW